MSAQVAQQQLARCGQSARRGVLIVGQFASRWGANRQVCEELADRLAQQGWPITVAGTEQFAPLRLLRAAARAWRCRSRNEVAQIDVFSGRSFLLAEATAWVLRRAETPYILTLHGGQLPQMAGHSPRRVRRLLASAAAVTTPSGYLYDVMRSYRPDLQILRNGIDCGRYIFRLRQLAEPKLIWVRAFHALYNPLLALRVLRRLRATCPGASLTMIGPDKRDGSLPAFQAYAAAAELTAAVQIVGAVPKTEIGAWINRGDIFLNTSEVDNAPITLVEAMACGACIVSTDVGGIPYLLRDHETALLVPPHDSEAMVEAVQRIVSTPALAAKLSRNAAAEARQYDWSVVLPQWESLLSGVVRRPRNYSTCQAK